MIYAMGMKVKTVFNTDAERKYTSALRKQWYFYSKNHDEVCGDADINILDAWRISKGDPNIVIAVLDSEVDAHTGNHSIAHGKLCAEVAAGKCGVAPACSSLLVKFPLQANDDVLIEIFEEVSAKADIICCSWAVTPIYRPLSPALYECLSKIASNGGPRQNGCVICFAAGNFNAPVKDLQNKEFVWLDTTIDFLRITKGPIENGFASHPDVITVAACTSLKKKADYSNWGAEVDVCAPSNNFNPFSKEFTVEGRRDVPFVVDGISILLGATSFATALVVGVAALVRSANPGLDALSIKEILQATADKIIEEDSFSIPGKSKWFGCGKVNAAKSVSMATNLSFKQRNL